MNRLSRILLALIAVSMFVLAGCSSQHIVVNPEWKERPESVTVYMSRPYVENRDDLEDDLRDYVSNFEEWFAQEFKKNFVVETGIPVEVKIVEDEDYEIVPQPIEDVVMKVPLVNPNRVKEMHDVVVALHPIRFNRYGERRHTAQGTQIVNKRLNAQGAFSIASAADRQELAYGIFFAESGFRFAMTTGNWEKVVREIVQEVVAKTPLRR